MKSTKYQVFIQYNNGRIISFTFDSLIECAHHAWSIHRVKKIHAAAICELIYDDFFLTSREVVSRLVKDGERFSYWSGRTPSDYLLFQSHFSTKQ